MVAQATSEPSLQPLPETAQRAPGNSTTSNNLWATKLAPPYLVDEASFTDACKRLSSVEDSALLGKSGAGGGSPATAAGLAADIAGPEESLMRSLGCLASFRVAPELLTSHGRGTAKRLKRLSKSEVWGPDVRNAAARLLRAWRGVVDVGGGATAYSKAATKRSQDEERGGAGSGGGGAGSSEGGAKAKVGAEQIVDRVRPAASTKPRLVGEKEQEEEENDEQQGISSSGHKSPAPMPDAGSSSSDFSPKVTCPPEKQQKEQQQTPKRPSLVPAALWDRLSQEFNVSQLRAIWAAAASAREAHEDLAAAARGNDGPATPETAVLAERRAPVNHAAAATANRREGGARGGGSKGGVVLLQGPPGTGKTRTVLGVVSAILARREEKDCASGGGRSGASARGMGTTLAPEARQKRPGVAGRWVAAKTHQRVLVCAPSNGAVDELAQRLALESGGVWDQRGNATAPRVVRLGKPSEDAADRVKAVSLEFMVEERVKLHAKSAEARNAETKIRETHARIDEAGRAVRSGDVGEVGGMAGIGSAENRDALRSLDVERGKIRRSLVSNAQARLG
ncbi:unnamed protein product [Ectocarpus sp. CCAP 1310/34]|nr:unnamed protein product [Ectocarpus sp. CCAP 1310/34]